MASHLEVMEAIPLVEGATGGMPRLAPLPSTSHVCEGQHPPPLQHASVPRVIVERHAYAISSVADHIWVRAYGSRHMEDTFHVPSRLEGVTNAFIVWLVSPRRQNAQRCVIRGPRKSRSISLQNISEEVSSNRGFAARRNGRIVFTYVSTKMVSRGNDYC